MLNENAEEVFMCMEDDLDKALNHLKGQYMVIRAGRANPHVLDKVFVDYYGQPTPIVQMGTVSVSEARILCINIWDQSQIRNVVKAIASSDIGITPTDDGKTIRLVFPALTEERRKQLVKDVKKLAEECKVTMRNARRDALDAFKNMKKNNEITEDDMSQCETRVQKMVEDATGKVDKECTLKEQEIMTV